MTANDRVRDLPLWKRAAFSLVPAFLVVLGLIAAEVVLRSTGPAIDDRLVAEVQFDGITWYQTNRACLAKYFPPGSAMVPEFKTTLFRKEKLPQTFRVMCLGSSTMFGTPYDMNANIAGILRRQLRQRYPKTEWEFVNWGASAINSNVVRDIADDLLAFRPDLVIIYMGHNEYYGPDGIGASYPERVFPWLTPVKYRLREFRLVQWLQRWVASPPRASAPLMQQVSGGHHVALRSDESVRVLDHFRANLEAILQIFGDAHVPVIVSDITSNLMFPPFATDPVIGGRDAATFSAAMRRDADAGRFANMLAAIDTIGRDGEGHPLVLYWKGVALRGLGRPADAAPLLREARDNDLLKFRAPGEINTIIHEVTARQGVMCISADSLLQQTSRDGIQDDLLFWEHLHPTPAGYYHIAGGFLEAISRSGIVREAPATDRVVPLSMDSLHICWLDLAYGDASIQHLTGRWPFEHYSRTPLVLGDADPALLQLVRDTHARKLAWNEACYHSATVFWRTGRLREALTTYRAMLEEYPFGFYTNYLAGSLLNVMGEKEEAMMYLRSSLLSNPDYLPAHLDLGLLEVNAGRYAEGEGHLRVVVQRAGTAAEQVRLKANAFYGLGAAAANRGEVDLALAAVEQALALQPGYPDAVRLRAALQQGSPSQRLR